MKFKCFFTLILLLNISFIKADGLLGGWLLYQYFYFSGCRQNGMAGAGYSLPNDENLLLLNPAGLGIENERFRKAAFSYGNAFEPHLEGSFLFQDHYISSCFQPFKSYVGGISFLMDCYALTDRIGIPQIYLEDPYNPVFTGDTLYDNHINLRGILGYGRDLSFLNIKNHSIGVSAKLSVIYKSYYGEPVRDGIIHLDAGYAGSVFNNFHIGFVISNIPVIKSFNPDKEITLPLCIVPALGFKRAFGKRSEKDIFSIFTETNYKIALQGYDNGRFHHKNRFITGGYEIGIMEVLFLRNGYRWIFDNEFDLGKFEISNGIGFNNRKHFELNFYFSLLIYTYDDVDIDPAKRFGLSINFFNLSKKHSD